MGSVRCSLTVGPVDAPRHPGSVWIEENRGRLKDDFWVAANERGLVSEHPTIDGLIQSLEQTGVCLRDVAVAYISSDPV